MPVWHFLNISICYDFSYLKSPAFFSSFLWGSVSSSVKWATAGVVRDSEDSPVICIWRLAHSELLLHDAQLLASVWPRQPSVAAGQPTPAMAHPSHKPSNTPQLWDRQLIILENTWLISSDPTATNSCRFSSRFKLPMPSGWKDELFDCKEK